LTALVFAYGSNLNMKQMLRRCSQVRVASTGVLRHHELLFAGWSAAWRSPVATVLPRLGGEVPGVLYEVSEKGLAALDRCEGHPHVYRRDSLIISTPSGRGRRAHVYCMNAALAPVPPRSRYFFTILAAYREWGFDEAPLIRAALDV
jgi:gamma-glutamylcyclotransferase (GGCT)/AIG2-like uncharacterized protein YtfP